MKKSKCFYIVLTVQLFVCQLFGTEKVDRIAAKKRQQVATFFSPIRRRLNTEERRSFWQNTIDQTILSYKNPSRIAMTV